MIRFQNFEILNQMELAERLRRFTRVFGVPVWPVCLAGFDFEVFVYFLWLMKVLLVVFNINVSTLFASTYRLESSLMTNSRKKIYLV